jgi:phosphoglycolate phosphatase-like HAD superfamily hydrolase
MKFLMFDFDGPIVSTFSLAFETFNKIEHHALSEEEYRKLLQGNMFRTVGPEFGGTGDRVTEITPFFKLYGPELLKKQPVPGMIELLKELKASGFSMVIISSTMDDLLEDFLTKNGIRDCFTAIYGSTYHKSKVYKIEHALEDAGVSASDALFITDTMSDLHDAAECKVPAIAVAWGYHPAETLKKGNPIAIAQTVEELKQLIFSN